MTTWEYVVLHWGAAGDRHLVHMVGAAQEAVSGATPLPRIHELGRAGWELFSVVALPEAGTFEYWFKRPLP